MSSSPLEADAREKGRLMKLLKDEADAFLAHALAHPQELVRAAAATVAEPADRQAVAERAQHTRDAAVYALALHACWKESPSPSCGKLGLARLAELDGHNAAVWFLVAAEEMTRGDESAAATALHRAAQGTTMDPRLHLAAATLAALPWPQDRIIGRMVVAETAAQATLAVAVPNYSGLVRHCSESATVDANRRSECSALAAQLSRPASSLLDANVAASIAKRGAWEPAQVVALEQRLQAARSRSATARLPSEQRWSCDAGESYSRWVTEAAAVGEFAMLER